MFKVLEDVLAVSHKKFHVENKKDETRLKWGRLMVNAVGVYGKLLETVQLEQLAKDIEEIKAHIGMKT